MTLERRTPLKRSPMKRTTKQLARVSKKRKSGEDGIEFPQAVKDEVWRRAGGRCEKPDCARRLTRYHHRRRRTQGGKGTLDNCMGLCDPCHRWIHDNPAISFDNDWLRHAWGG